MVSPLCWLWERYGGDVRLHAIYTWFLDIISLTRTFLKRLEEERPHHRRLAKDVPRSAAESLWTTTTALDLPRTQGVHRVR